MNKSEENSVKENKCVGSFFIFDFFARLFSFVKHEKQDNKPVTEQKVETESETKTEPVAEQEPQTKIEQTPTINHIPVSEPEPVSDSEQVSESKVEFIEPFEETKQYFLEESIYIKSNESVKEEQEQEQEQPQPLEEKRNIEDIVSSIENKIQAFHEIQSSLQG